MSSPVFDRTDRTAQVIGVAYTYETSQTARRELTDHDRSHSAWTDSFSFFVKCRLDQAVGHRGELRLRPGAPAPHWPEAELAAMLGPGHDIVAYALANDLTAFAVETGGDADRTFLGKCWQGSCGIGPAFVPAAEVGPVDDLAIGLRVERGGRVVYDREYRTSSRRRQFREIPDLIVSRLQQLGEAAPRSKRVRLDHTGLLPPGTVILLGTGLIAPPEAYCRPGVRVTVGCPRLGELTHVVTAG